MSVSRATGYHSIDAELLDYGRWQPTRDTVHRLLQMAGKLRLAHSARSNHWWNVPFHLTGSGLTTRPMGADPSYAIDLDFIDHRVVVTADDATRASFDIPGRTVAGLHSELMAALERIGVDPQLTALPAARPFDLPDSGRRFADDVEHGTYDRDAARAYWRTLAVVNLTLEEFSRRYSGKVSPVHHFWHTFDIATTRFSDVVVAPSASADAVTREAYSREAISFGFWFGDAQHPAPAFYSYTAPEPAGLAIKPLASGGRWHERGSSHLAVLTWSDAVASAKPRDAVLDFLESAYRAGATLAGWDIDRYDCPDGVTDPSLTLGSWA